MHTLGDDFEWQNAHKTFTKTDKVLKYIRESNEFPNIELFYSTPEEYVKSIYEENINWPVNKYDYFPYADKPHSYWTGYFTSRPHLKKDIKFTGRKL